VDLVSHDHNAQFFKSAYWWFGVHELGETRSRVECLVHFDLRFRYVWLAPVLFFFRRGIQRDLVGLKRVLKVRSDPDRPEAELLNVAEQDRRQEDSNE